MNFSTSLNYVFGLAGKKLFGIEKGIGVYGKLREDIGTLLRGKVRVPEKEHRQLAASAKKVGLKAGSDRFNAYVYGTLDKIEKARKRKHRFGQALVRKYA